ncbi:hypothetical protein SESBI_28355 [Sesbania bispinosa]|nr:hypothetical protein SESBI_28355 [Sesbania bispinosa]
MESKADLKRGDLNKDVIKGLDGHMTKWSNVLWLEVAETLALCLTYVFGSETSICAWLKWRSCK